MRPTRTALWLLTVAAAATTVVGLTGASLPGGDGARGAAVTGCTPGSQPARAYGERPPEPGFVYATRPVVLGCASLSSGARVEVVGYRFGRPGRSSLCIDINDLGRRGGGGCGSDRIPYGDAIGAGGFSAGVRGPLRLTGTTARIVTRVLVRWERSRRLRARPAALVRVRTPALLASLHVRRAFGIYVAEVPRGARAVSAEGRDARGRARGLAFFAGFRGPAGAGQRCFTRPRITGLRALGTARARRTVWVRARVSYVRGRTTSIRFDSPRGAGGIADLVPAPARRGVERRAVTVPLRFDRRGRVLLSAVAEGLPRDRRCGLLVRRSTPRELALSVR